MGRAAKAILVIIGLVGVLMLIGVAVVAYFVTRDGGAFMKDQQRVVNEGHQYGTTADDSACLVQAQKRLKAEAGFGGGLKSVVFLQHCVKPARKSDAYCEGVPMPLEMIDSAAYQQKQCDDAGLGNNPFCPSLYSEVQQECYRRWLDKKFEE